jgi:hypothetical protein
VSDAKQATKSDYPTALKDAWRLSHASRAESMFLLSAWAVYFIYYLGYAFGKEAIWN